MPLWSGPRRHPSGKGTSRAELKTWYPSSTSRTFRAFPSCSMPRNTTSAHPPIILSSPSGRDQEELGTVVHIPCAPNGDARHIV